MMLVDTKLSFGISFFPRMICHVPIVLIFNMVKLSLCHTKRETAHYHPFHSSLPPRPSVSGRFGCLTSTRLRFRRSAKGTKLAVPVRIRPPTLGAEYPRGATPYPPDVGLADRALVHLSPSSKSPVIFRPALAILFFNVIASCLNQ